MADKVFINGRSAVHAGSPGKSMAFPDVNLCPPTPPAGPVPLPLPNIAQAADLQGGADTVTIGGNPMGKQSSFFAKSTGNESAQSTGGGVVSHVVQGKAYFVSYSVDVTIEGEKAVRHLDMMTHNHAAQSPPNAAMGTYLGSMDPAVVGTAQEKKPENKSTTFEIFLSVAAGRDKDHADSYELSSTDGKYKQTLSASDGQKQGDNLSLKFKDLLPRKVYSLFQLHGGDSAKRFPVFERVPFGSLVQESPGAAPVQPQSKPPPKKQKEQPPPPDDPLLKAEKIDLGDDWYWAHHMPDDDEDEG
jgi:hypothetical protein